jgi:hypothetical protein
MCTTGTVLSTSTTQQQARLWIVNLFNGLRQFRRQPPNFRWVNSYAFVYRKTPKNMSDNNRLANNEGSDHAESTGEDLNPTHAELTSIHSDLSSTAQSRDDEEEITAPALR